MNPRSKLGLDPIEQARQHWIDHGWNGAADGMAVVTSIVRSQQILLGRIERVLRPLNLTFARYEVLMILEFSRRRALPLGKIGSRLQVQPGAITNAVDRLEADGFVERRDHPTDGRTTLARLTAKGRRLAARATTKLNDEVFCSTGLDGREATELLQILRILRADAGDFDL